MTKYVTFNTDHWEDHGLIYEVLSYKEREGSTAIEFELKKNDGTTHKRVECRHIVEWLDGPNQQ